MAENTQSQDRTARADATREVQKRPMTWKPSSALPVPRQDSEWVYRWIRKTYFGSDDPTNMSRKMREGWEPVNPNEHKELALFTDPRQRQHAQMVEVGGLILARMPREMAEARRKYYEQITQQQMKSIDERLAAEQTDSRMPIFNERRTKVSNFGRGS